MMVLRALVIDPDEASRREINRQLGLHHFECREARDLIEALGHVSPYGIDLIVADLAIQSFGNLTLAALLRMGAFGEQPPPVITILDPFESAQNLSHDEGINSIRVPKPLTEGELASAIDRAFLDQG